MSEINFDDRLRAIERRLSRIETVLGLVQQIEPPIAQPSLQLNEPHIQPQVSVSVEKIRQIDAPQEHHAVPPPLPMMEVQSPRVISYLPPAPKPLATRSGMEQTIGLKWAGWIGAIVLVIGAGLGIKFAYDQGWLSAVPPAMRLGIMALAGMGLIAMGEWIYRRVHTFSAVGFFGAGIAVLFLVSYSGHAYYDLYPKNIAFMFMGVTTLVGAAAARRGNVVSIAVLATIGGNLAPAFLSDRDPRIVAFLSYLLMLQLTSLLLAFWGGTRKWWTLRGLSLATTTIWVAVILAGSARGSFDTTLIFVLIFAVLYQAEVIFSTSRSKDHATLPGPTFSLLVSTVVSTAVLYWFRDSGALIRTSWILSFAAICGTMAFGCSRRVSQSVGMRRLSSGFLIQSAALIAVVVPVALSGIWIAAGWGVLATAFAVLGFLLDIPVATFAAPAVWLLADAALAFWTEGGLSGRSHRDLIWLRIVGTNIPAYACMAWMLVMASHLIARITDRNRRRAFVMVARILIVLAALLWVDISLVSLPPLGATGWVLVYAWLLAIEDLVADETSLLVLSVAMLMLASAKWFISDTLGPMLSLGSTSAGPISPLTPMVGVAIAASVAGIYHLRRDRILALMDHAKTDVDRAASGIWFAIALVLLWAGTIEIDRTVTSSVTPGLLGLGLLQWKNLLWTSWWMIGTSLYLLTMRIGRDRKVWAILLSRYWSLPAILAIKFLLLDTLYFRIIEGVGVAPVVVNPRAAAATIVFAGLAMLMVGLVNKSIRAAVIGLAVLVALGAGSFEIDQLFNDVTATKSLANPGFAEQMSLSVFWSIFALVSVAIGFRCRAAGLRYFGLVMFGVTLLKVVTIDLSQLSTGYRILSFLGLGILLMGMSVLYGKLTPGTLGENPKTNENEM